MISLTYSVDTMRQTALGPLEPLVVLGDMTALSLFLDVAAMALCRDTG